MCKKGEGAEKETVKQAEEDFAEFFIGIISKLYDMKCRQISYDVRSALRDIRAMKREENRNKPLSYSYKIPQVKCAYLYGYSVLHSVMIYSEFLKHLRRNKRYIMPNLRTDSLKICCIGGGPGTEAVAICKAINDFAFKKSHAGTDESLLEVKVTVVDKLPQWKREEAAVINAVNDKSNILHSERMTVHSDFLKADILKPFEESLKEKIKEADIVTFIKVASYMQNDYQEDLQNMLRNVINCMDVNSCLFMLDNAGGSVFYNLRDVLAEWSGLSLLRRSEHIQYSLDQRTVKLLSGLMRYNNDSKYQPILPTGLGKVSSCLWIKSIFPVRENTEVSGNELGASNVNSENSCSPSLQCDGNSVRNKSENDSKTDCVVAHKPTVPKMRQKKKKHDSKNQKQPKDTDVLIISKTPKRKNIKVPRNELGVNNANSENSCSLSLQCDGNSVRNKSENDSQTECVLVHPATVPKMRQKKEKHDSKNQKQPKDTDVLIISKTPTRKNIEVPSNERSVNNMKSKISCASTLKCEGNLILNKRKSDSNTEYVVAPQTTVPKKQQKYIDSKKQGQPGPANVLIERYINCKTKRKKFLIKDLVGAL